ncbi:MAG: isoprenylcysteine carboxylmethyltransferase family protein [Anaerolineales bacterium]
MTNDNLRLRALRSTLALPVGVLTILPIIIIWLTASWHPGWGLAGAAAYLPALAGLALMAVGLSLIAATVRLFLDVGHGTLAPWDPPQNLVVAGPYRHVRNPMHSGVFLTLYGESLLTGSVPLLLICTAIFVFHWFYIPLMEERWLTDKFGQDYLTYKQHVPAWIPRLTAWQRGQK